MLVPGIFKLGRVSIMLQIWHLDFMHFFATGKGWCCGDLCLTLGGCLYVHRVVLQNKCLAAGMLQ